MNYVLNSTLFIGSAGAEILHDLRGVSAQPRFFNFKYDNHTRMKLEFLYCSLN
jgi:hypothetical protein